MAKFTFTREETTYYNNAKSSTEFSAVSIDDVLIEFEQFLKGAGFVFDGRLEIVQDYYDTYTDVNKDIHVMASEEADVRW
jgi:hypothetical protein